MLALARRPCPGPTHYLAADAPTVLTNGLRVRRHAVCLPVRASAAESGPPEDDNSVTGSPAWRVRPAAVRSVVRQLAGRHSRGCKTASLLSGGCLRAWGLKQPQVSRAPVTRPLSSPHRPSMDQAAAQVALPRALNGPGRWFLLAGFLKVLLLAQLHTPSAVSYVFLGTSCDAAKQRQQRI